MTAEQDDPEASYRRGYHQGAFDALAAAEKLGLPNTPSLRHWVDLELYDWRYGPRKDERTVPPPESPQSN